MSTIKLLLGRCPHFVAFDYLDVNQVADANYLTALRDFRHHLGLPVDSTVNNSVPFSRGRRRIGADIDTKNGVDDRCSNWVNDDAFSYLHSGMVLSKPMTARVCAEQDVEQTEAVETLICHANSRNTAHRPTYCIGRNASRVWRPNVIIILKNPRGMLIFAVGGTKPRTPEPAVH